MSAFGMSASATNKDHQRRFTPIEMRVHGVLGVSQIWTRAHATALSVRINRQCHFLSIAIIAGLPFIALREAHPTRLNLCSRPYLPKGTQSRRNKYCAFRQVNPSGSVQRNELVPKVTLLWL